MIFIKFTRLFLVSFFTLASILWTRNNKNNTSGVRGVHFDKDRGLWVAQIMFQRKAHILGRFKTKREAVKARLAGEEEYFGKYR